MAVVAICENFDWTVSHLWVENLHYLKIACASLSLPDRFDQNLNQNSLPSTFCYSRGSCYL